MKSLLEGLRHDLVESLVIPSELGVGWILDEGKALQVAVSLPGNLKDSLVGQLLERHGAVLHKFEVLVNHVLNSSELLGSPSLPAFDAPLVGLQTLQGVHVRDIDV